jgi:hypothetical protein
VAPELRQGFSRHRAEMVQDDWLHGSNLNVEEWFEGDRYGTLAICRNLAPRRCGIEGGHRAEALRPVQDPQPNASGEAASRG